MSSPFGPITIICNARSGRGRVRKNLPRVQAELEGRGLEHKARLTEAPGHATHLARAAIEDGSTFLVAMGGDGTIHEVVNGMIEDDKLLNPDSVLGIVSAGTGCDFIRTFGLPSDPVHAVAHLDGSESFPIDIGKVSFESAGQTATRYFANIAEVGLGAATLARAQRLPRWLGPTVYFVAFWMTIGRYRSSQVVVDLVDREYVGLMNNLVVANGQFFGGGMRIAPKSAPTDGLLDIQIEHARKKEAIAILPKIYKGEHLPHPDIEEAKRVRAAITSQIPLPVEADGEVLGTTPATFEVVPDALRLKV